MALFWGAKFLFLKQSEKSAADSAYIGRVIIQNTCEGDRQQEKKTRLFFLRNWIRGDKWGEVVELVCAHVHRETIRQERKKSNGVKTRPILRERPGEREEQSFCREVQSR